MFKPKRKPSISSQDLLIPALDAEYWSLKLPDYSLAFAFFVLLHEWSGASGHLNLLQLKLFPEQLRGKNNNENLFRSHIITFLPLHPRSNHGCTSKSAARCFVQMASLYPWRRSQKGSFGDTCRRREDPVEESGLFLPWNTPATSDHCQAPASGGGNIKAPRSEIIPPPPKKKEKRWNRQRKVEMT